MHCKQYIELLGARYVDRWQSEESDSNFEYIMSKHSDNVLADVSGFDYVGHNSFYVYRKDAVKINNKFRIYHYNSYKYVNVDFDGELLLLQQNLAIRLNLIFLNSF